MTISKAPPPINPVSSSSLRIKTPEALKPAKWSLWSYKPYWGIWDACCLTFDFEPNKDGLHTWHTYKRLPNNFPADFADRFDILSTNFNMGERGLSADLAAFALSCGWSIPAEMKSLIKMPAPIAQAQDNETRAPIPIATEQKKGTAKAAPTGPRLQVNKAALIAQHKHEWPTIEGDIKSASENGLSQAAKAGARNWYEDDAVQWARSKNRLVQPTNARTLDNVMGKLPSRTHRLEG